MGQVQGGDDRGALLLEILQGNRCAKCSKLPRQVHGKRASVKRIETGLREPCERTDPAPVAGSVHPG